MHERPRRYNPVAPAEFVGCRKTVDQVIADALRESKIEVASRAHLPEDDAYLNLVGFVWTCVQSTGYFGLLGRSLS